MSLSEFTFAPPRRARLRRSAGGVRTGCPECRRGYSSSNLARRSRGYDQNLPRPYLCAAHDGHRRLPHRRTASPRCATPTAS